MTCQPSPRIDGRGRKRAVGEVSARGVISTHAPGGATSGSGAGEGTAAILARPATAAAAPAAMSTFFTGRV